VNKRVVISIALIVALGLVLAIKKARFGSAVPDIGKWSGEADEIVIEGAGSSLRLHKKDGKWVINEAAYPADAKTVVKLENQLRDLELADLISEKPHLDRFDLDAGKARRVVARRDKKPLRDILLGKKSSTYRHTYVKLADRPEVFLARGPLADDFAKSADDLRDKEVMKIDQASIESFEIEYKGARLSFAKKTVEIKDEKPAADPAAPKGTDAGKGAGTNKDAKPVTVAKWTCAQLGGAELDEGKLNGILSSFASVVADAYAERPDPALMRARTCSIKLRAGGKDMTLVIAGRETADRKRYLATSSESPYAFFLNAHGAERYFVTAADMKKK